MVHSIITKLAYVNICQKQFLHFNLAEDRFLENQSGDDFFTKLKSSPRQANVERAYYS